MANILAGKVALVTGAGRGIGRALALGFANEGAAVACLSRTPAEIQQLVVEIETTGGRGLAIPTDVSVPAQVDAAVAACVAAFGGLDLMVINAGIFPDRKMVEHGDLEAWRRTLDVNLFGAMVCAKAAIGPLRSRRGGKIIVVGSGHAHRATPGSAVYAASKAGLWMFIRVLAQELAGDNIAINEIVTGPVATSIAPNVRAGEIVASSPYERFKAPEEIVPLALFLAGQPDHGPTGQSFSLSRRDL